MKNDIKAKRSKTWNDPIATGLASERDIVEQKLKGEVHVHSVKAVKDDEDSYNPIYQYL